MFFTAFFHFLTGEREVPKHIGPTEIGADVPIKESDQDLLRRVSFAERIATILSELSLEEGRVFAVRGQWGSGKTSLKNLVIEQLGSRKGSAEWMDFNPWQWGDGEAIAKALFQQIADKIGGALSSKARSSARTRLSSLSSWRMHQLWRWRHLLDGHCPRQQRSLDG